MNLMAQNSMVRSGISERVSTVIDSLDDLHFDRMKNYVNIGVNKDNEELNIIGVPTQLPSSSVKSDYSQQENLKKNFDSLVTSQFDEQVYANFSEILKHDELENIDRRPDPPFPALGAFPIRTLSSGWQEYITLGGRSYYYHPENKICQWKPPRTRQSMNSSTTSTNLQFNHCEPSTSNEVFSEMPLRNEYDMACCLSDDLIQVPDGMVSYHSALLKVKNCNITKDLMNCSMTKSTTKNNLLNHSNYFDDQNNVSVHSQANSTEFAVGNHEQSPTNFGNSQQFSSLDQSVISALSQNNFSATAIRQGPLEKCRLSDSGLKIKKREWISSYAYLYSSHLLFYKDQKSAEKTGKHYPAPTDVCDLRGAILSYANADKQKDKRRKHVLLLVLINKTEYLFSCSGNESEINSWFHALRQTISILPAMVQTYLMPTILDFGGSLQRASMKNKTLILQSSKNSSAFSTKSSLNRSVKSKLKNSGSKDSVENSNGSCSDTKQILENNLSRESIIERLLRFFRSRPTVESLRECGIYKTEPVFGSTLSAICAHEKSIVPKFLTEVTRLIEEKGLDIDGLYRVNGNLSSVQKIRCHIDQEKYEALRTEDDVHVLTGALKLFFRELSEPIFPLIMNKEFMSAIREPNMRQKFKSIDDLLQRLPLVNKETLKVLLSHLERVSTHSGKNRMQIHNLAIMFGPTLFGTEDRTARKVFLDNKGRNTKRKVSEKKDEVSTQSEPNQNLAYKMVIYGQIVEFILNESKKFTIFQKSTF